MTPARFLELRSAAWDRLEVLVRKAGRHGVRRLTDAELHELTRLYPAVAVDVARARLHELDPSLQQRINHLAIGAHGLLYRRRRARLLRPVVRFFRHDYPQLFRRQWAFIALAIAVFLAGFAGAYASSRMRPATAYLFVPCEMDLPDGQPGVSAEDISERFRGMPNPPMAAGVMSNNISVAFNAFALGITAGVGACYVVLFNAMMLGGFAGHFANHHLAYTFWSFILPHGLLEIFAILIAAAAGLRLGAALAVPGGLTRMASLRRGAREAVLLVLGTIPMFAAAGVVEGFVTPSYLPDGLKLAIGVVLWAMVLMYLLVWGRGTEAGRTETPHDE